MTEPTNELRARYALTVDARDLDAALNADGQEQWAAEARLREAMQQLAAQHGPGQPAESDELERLRREIYVREVSAKDLHKAAARGARYADEQRQRAERAEAAISRAKALHYPNGRNIQGAEVCVTCWPLQPFPCATVRALNGEAS